MKVNCKKINDTAVRALEILKILFQNEGDQDYIMKKLRGINIIEDDLRTDSLYKYFNTFKLFGLDVKRNDGKYFIEKMPFSKNFSDEDIEILCFLRLYAKTVLDKNNALKIENFVNKFCNCSVNCNVEKLIELEPVIKLKYGQLLKSELNKDLFETFKMLCKEQQKITFKYYNSQLEEYQNFNVEPKEILITPKKYILKAYNPSVAEIQEFSIDDISDLKQLPIKTKATSIKSAVTFKLKGRLAISYELKIGERVVETKDDYKIITNSEEDKDILMKRLLRYGAACEVLYPQKFRDRTIKILENIKNLYR